MSTHDENGETRRLVNQLVDHYEQFAPDVGKCIAVRMTPKELCRVFDVPPKLEPDGKKIFPSEISYRGRTLRATLA